MSTKRDVLLKLELFNEKTTELERSRFFQWLTGGPKHPDYVKIAAGDWLAYGELHPEHLAAFVLPFRLLIQRMDRHSIHDLPGHYTALGLPEAEKLANQALSELKAALAEESLVQTPVPS